MSVHPYVHHLVPFNEILKISNRKLVSLYLRDLLVFDNFSLNIYNSEKSKKFWEKGKISVDGFSLRCGGWRSYFESDTTTSRDPTRWAGWGIVIVVPHQYHTTRMTQYPPPINLYWKIEKFNQKFSDRRIDDVYLGQRFTAIYHGWNFRPHFELELTGIWPLTDAVFKVF